MAINWRLFTFDFYGITLHGKESSSQAPLFVADHLRVGLKIVSLLRRKVDLNEIVLDQPIAHLNIDRDGVSNLPQSPSTFTQSRSTINDFLDLAIQYVELNSGQIYYNDKKSPLDAEMHDFRVQIHFIPVVKEYRGTLGYGDGRVETIDFRPITHRLQLSFTVNRSGMVVDPMTVATPKSTLTVHAKLTDYAQVHVEGNYDAVVSTIELARIIKNQSIPSGGVSLTGGLRYDNDPHKGAANSVYLDGHMSSPQLVMNMGQMQTTAKSIRAEYRLQNGNLSVRNLGADLLGGHLGANYELSHISGSSSSHIDASVRDVSLDAMNNSAGPRNSAPVSVSGRIDGTVGASWTSDIKNGTAFLLCRRPFEKPAPSYEPLCLLHPFLLRWSRHKTTARTACYNHPC